jgi:hypothetical protein
MLIGVWKKYIAFNNSLFPGQIVLKSSMKRGEELVY